MRKYWLKPDWEPGTSIHKIRKEELLTRNIKALLLDVDGTLLPRNKKLLESFWDSNNSKILAKELEKDYKKRVSPYRLISKLLND